MAASHEISRQKKTSAVLRSESSVIRVSVPGELLQSWLTCFHKAICGNEKWLTELDRAIGDADHGTNMRRGMERVMEHIGEFKGVDLATQFRMVSSHLTASVGGASGPLYGAFFLHASCVIPDRGELRMSDFATCLEAGLQGVVGLGHARAGDKTMVDVLLPVVSAYKSMSRRQAPPMEILSEGSLIAEAAMKSTVPMQAAKGRASYLGTRSIGHQDPGATSMYLLMRALVDACAKKSFFSANQPKPTARKLIP